MELSRLLRADPPGHAIRKSKVAPGQYITPMVSQPRLDPAASPRLHDYQRVAHTPGPLLAACLLVVIVALVLARGRGRLLSRRGGRAGRRASSARRHRARARPGRGQLVSCLVIGQVRRDPTRQQPAAGVISATMLVLEDMAE